MLGRRLRKRLDDIKTILEVGCQAAALIGRGLALPEARRARRLLIHPPAAILRLLTCFEIRVIV
jgi:hypothetical protein